MAPTILIVADGEPGDELAEQLGPAAPRFAASFLADTVALARAVTGARVSVRHSPLFPVTALMGLPRGLEVAPIAAGAPAMAAALAEALAWGDPALLIGVDSPHLPLWRLRDALTHLADGADLVIGPGDRGDWYLLGFRSAATDLLPHIPILRGPAGGLRRAAQSGGKRVATLPAWFSIRNGAALATLAEVLRTMPPQIAAQTRALLSIQTAAARAVGG